MVCKINSCPLRWFDIVHGYNASPVAKATDEPLGIDLLLDSQQISFSEAQLVTVVTDVSVESFHSSTKSEYGQQLLLCKL